MLAVKDLRVKIEEKEILRGVDLEIKEGEIVALMGPNGSGKSSLAYAIAGHPKYEISGGKLILEGEEINEETVDERAKKGIFLAFQYPVGIAGVSVREVMLAALRGRGDKRGALEIRKVVEEEARKLKVSEELLKRDINEGFSGGEKKKMEILQLKLLKPKYALLDETDSGLDIDALKIVAEGARVAAAENKSGVLVITHYQRILKYLKPDRVVILKGGKIVDEGGSEIVTKLEKEGYAAYD